LRAMARSPSCIVSTSKSRAERSSVCWEAMRLASRLR
jgi:hypothetical protein